MQKGPVTNGKRTRGAEIVAEIMYRTFRIEKITGKRTQSGGSEPDRDWRTHMAKTHTSLDFNQHQPVRDGESFRKHACLRAEPGMFRQ